MFPSLRSKPFSEFGRVGITNQTHPKWQDYTYWSIGLPSIVVVCWLLGLAWLSPGPLDRLIRNANLGPICLPLACMSWWLPPSRIYDKIIQECWKTRHSWKTENFGYFTCHFNFFSSSLSNNYIIKLFQHDNMTKQIHSEEMSILFLLKKGEWNCIRRAVLMLFIYTTMISTVLHILDIVRKQR